jgi:hypothetical protein
MGEILKEGYNRVNFAVAMPHLSKSNASLGLGSFSTDA